MSCAFTDANELVRYTNGQCHSWVNFMRQVLSAQGLATVNGQQTLAIAALEGTIRLNGFLRKLPDNEVVNEYVPFLPQGRVWRR